MTLETSKILGGIGALLMFLGILPYIGYFGIVEIVGVILVLVSLYGLANFYREKGIFNNAIFGVLAAIVGAIISGVVVVVTVLASLTDFLYQVFPDWNGDWATIQGLTPNTANIDPSAILPFITGMILVFVVVWVFAIIAAFFIRRSLKELAVRSGTGLFSTAGLLLLVGAVLIIIFGLGIILVWIATLILAIAFFTMKTPEPVPPPTVELTPPPPPTSV
ncbi:MAG: DUF996 domain-containing protein [Candidatus Bathyarchaeia archaeon]|jgi:uncharacterized membrane protein